MMKLRRVLFIIGLIILFLMVFISLFPSLFTPYGVKESFTAWEGVSKGHILGCNDMGYDIYTELIYGTKNTLFTGFMVTVITVILGVILGMIASENNALGKIIDGITSTFALLPRLVILIVLSVFLKSGRWTLILLISLFSWCPMAREVKAESLRIRNLPFMDSYVVRGYKKSYIALVHILPNLRGVIIPRILLTLTSSVMMESSLSFLGLGDTYYPSWGTMMGFAFKRGAFLNGGYFYLLAPGFAISALALSAYFISQFLEENKNQVKEVKEHV